MLIAVLRIQLFGCGSGSRSGSWFRTESRSRIFFFNLPIFFNKAKFRNFWSYFFHLFVFRLFVVRIRIQEAKILRILSTG